MPHDADWKKLRVVLVTGHVAFTKVARGLSRDGIGTTLDLTYQSLRDCFGIQRPRIAVAALNPHGGEEGILRRGEKPSSRPSRRPYVEGSELAVRFPRTAFFIKRPAAITTLSFACIMTKV